METQDLIQNLQVARRQGKLNPLAQLLYYELGFFYKSLQVTGPFYCTNTYLCKLLGISDKTLIQARNELIKAKLINYSLPRRKHPGIYLLPNPIDGYIPLETEIDGNTPPKPEMDGDIPAISQIDGESPDNINNNILYIQKEKINKKEKEMQAFEEFRQLYPGRKRGLETEFQYFTKKHNDYQEVLPLLVPAIRRLTEWHSQQLNLGLFAPPYPLMQVWINQRRWEEELPNNNVYE